MGRLFDVFIIISVLFIPVFILYKGFDPNLRVQFRDAYKGTPPSRVLSGAPLFVPEEKAYEAFKTSFGPFTKLAFIIVYWQGCSTRILFESIDLTQYVITAGLARLGFQNALIQYTQSKPFANALAPLFEEIVKAGDPILMWPF
jgi:hypothetical protein